MLRSIQSLKNFTMMATDGEIGKVKDFYFDDHTWTLRYLVVETGNWLFGRKVLISTVALHAPNWDSHSFPVSLTIDQVKHSPNIDTDKPVSRQHEADLQNHYLWPSNGGGLGFTTSGMVGGVIAPDIPFEDQIASEMHRADSEIGDKHLESVRQLKGYTLRAIDDEVGKVEDFLMEDTNWTIPFLVIETGDWYSGKRILTPTRFVDTIQWRDTSVYLLKSKDSLKNSPEFDYTQPLNEEYIRKFYNSDLDRN